MNDLTIGDRMKVYYEKPWSVSLPMRMPTIIRLDGKAFHTFTRGLEKPFDLKFIRSMSDLALYLCDNIQTAQLAYVQSDEISILLHPYKKLETQGWFANEIQKIVSVSAAMASAYFTQKTERLALFDSRVFVLPESEVVNYFVWRQEDWTKNSVQMLARSLYSTKELHGKHRQDMMDMMIEKGKNWNDLPNFVKRGTCVKKFGGLWGIDENPPIFTKNREYIHTLLEVEEE